MNTIRIHCGGCLESFSLEHPSIQVASDLQHVTLDCPSCGITLKMPEDEVKMISMAEFMWRSLVRQGIIDPTRQPEEMEFGYIEISEAPVDEPKPAPRPSPASMPPHPPKPRAPLFQRPFGDLKRRLEG